MTIADTGRGMTKAEFLRSLSDISGFTVGDTATFFDALTDLIAQCIEKQIPFVIKGFGSLEFTPVPARKGYHGGLKKMIDLPPTTRVVFRLAKSLRDYVKKIPESPNRQMSFLDE